ncbi:hypothetical protein [uncultured Alistipes sp.]|uniref:hypothetical protein n=1 Tax=uncultured Alistipes sp. TaxID=538949 RepID=UPI0026325F75|nr:hypothetical protein [uncultured Alistipes sp.]
MKTMKNFAAQQLSKKQMNDVKGGRVYVNCTIWDIHENKAVEWSHSATGATLEEALRNMHADLDEGQIAADCHISEL